MAILNLVKEVIFPLWSIFYTVIFLHAMPTRSSSRTTDQDIPRKDDTEEREENPFISFDTRFDHGEKDKSSGEEEYGVHALERKIDRMQREFQKEKEERKQAFGELLGIMKQIQTQLLALSVAKAINSPTVEDPTFIPFNFTFPSNVIPAPQIASSSTHIPLAQSPFRVESKVEIKVFKGRMDVESLETWIQALEVYFLC